MSGGRIGWDWCVWWKDRMGLVCLMEGYDGTGVSGGRIGWDWCVWWKDRMGLVCLVVGISSSGAIIVGRRSPGRCK